MRFNLYNSYGALNSQHVFNSFEQGLKAIGHDVVRNDHDADVAVIWSVLWYGRMRPNKEIFARYRKFNKPVIVLEVGNLRRDKSHDGSDPCGTWKVGLNGINRQNYFVQGQDNRRRSSLDLILSPWKSSGSHILICAQHERSQQWETMPSGSLWVEQQVKQLRQYTDRPIIFRPHPRFPMRPAIQGYNASLSTASFEQDLINSWAVVNWCSNPGVESVVKGIPAFVSERSLAYPVGNLEFSNIENPYRPDRDQWANDLAWTEWTQEEMRKGIPQTLLIDSISNCSQ